MKIQVLWDIITCQMPIFLLDAKDMDTTLLRNVGNTLPLNTVQRHGRHEFLVGGNLFYFFFLNFSVTVLDPVSVDSILYLCNMPFLPPCVKKVDLLCISIFKILPHRHGPYFRITLQRYANFENIFESYPDAKCRIIQVW